MAKKQTRAEVEAIINAHCAKEEGFKNEFLKQPKPLLKKVLGIDVHNDVLIDPVEEKSGEWVFVVKQAPKNASSLPVKQLAEYFLKSSDQGWCDK